MEKDLSYGEERLRDSPLAETLRRYRLNEDNRETQDIEQPQHLTGFPAVNAATERELNGLRINGEGSTKTENAESD